MTPISVVEKITKLGKKEVDIDYIEKIAKKNSERNQMISKTGILFKGIDSMKIALSPCCSPIYGDEIVGFVSKGQGIKVHRKDCPNVLNEKRLIDVSWDSNKPDIKYETSIKILAKDRSYLLTDLVTVVAQYKANLTFVNSSINHDNLTATTNLSFMVNDLEHLDTIITNLRKVDSVLEVERAIK